MIISGGALVKQPVSSCSTIEVLSKNGDVNTSGSKGEATRWAGLAFC